MKALVPDGHGSVRLDETAEPVPAPHEALVAVQAYSVNRGETFLLDAPRPGWRPGKDVAGTVLAAAADGTGPAAGTRVVGHAAASGWAERAAVATSGLAPLPDGVDVTTAAALPLAGLTALRLLRRAGSLVGRRLLVTGASGGVGHYLVELAVGADVTAVTATPLRGARLRELGAGTVSDPADAEGWFDVAMESVGGASFAATRHKVRPDGLLIWFGQASGQPITVDFFDWVDDSVGATITQFSYAEGDDAADLAALVRLVATDRLHPEIGSVAPWDRTAQALDDIRARRLRGNAVLTLT